MSVARRRPWSVVADCSMPSLQLQVAESWSTGWQHQHRRGVDRTQTATSSDIDVSRRLSARYGGAVPCTQWYARTHNRMWIRSGTQNASADPEAVESCALTSDVSRRVERRHLARTAVGPADIRKQKDIVRRNNCAYVERFLLAMAVELDCWLV